MKTEKLSTIATLELILAAYNNAVRTITKGNNEFKYMELRKKIMVAGVCLFCDENNIYLPKYIINRNVEKNSYYWCVRPYQLVMENKDPMEGIILRIIILEKELKHHKKWRFLAKYIKS